VENGQEVQAKTSSIHWSTVIDLKHFFHCRTSLKSTSGLTETTWRSGKNTHSTYS